MIVYLVKIGHHQFNHHHCDRLEHSEWLQHYDWSEEGPVDKVYSIHNPDRKSFFLYLPFSNLESKLFIRFNGASLCLWQFRLLSSSSSSSSIDVIDPK